MLVVHMCDVADSVVKTTYQIYLTVKRISMIKGMYILSTCLFEKENLVPKVFGRLQL